MLKGTCQAASQERRQHALDLGARETGDYGNMVDDVVLSLEPLVSGSVTCLCPGHFPPLLIMAHKENDT